MGCQWVRVAGGRRGPKHPGGKAFFGNSLHAFDPVGTEHSDHGAGAHLFTSLWETKPPGSLEHGGDVQPHSQEPVSSHPV